MGLTLAIDIVDLLRQALSVVGLAVLLLLLLPAIIVIRLLLKRSHPREKHAEHRKRAKRGEGYDLNELARRLDMSLEELQRIEPVYHQRQIPKKRGGARTLNIPSPALKHVQRRILRRLLKRLRVHPAAVGFEPGLSIAHNAGMHVGRAVVMKMDIENFFPSTREARVRHYFQRIGWDKHAAALLTRLTTHNGGLPQGAPTSPRLSNLVNHVMDAQINRYVKAHRGTYTRYADDITISYPQDFPRYVRGTWQVARRVARGHGYVLHQKGKLRIVRAHQQQRVTGLVVNDKVQLPRHKRRWLRAVAHRLRTTGKASLNEQQLHGWDSLQHMIRKQTI